MLAAMPRPLRAAALAAATAAVTLAALLTGCDGDDPAPEPAPDPTSTPLADFATDTVAIARDDFCSRVAPAAVEEALGAPPVASDDYANGERADLAPGVRDVAHEYGCSWSADDGTTARAWVFAPPVPPRQAGRLREAAAQAQGCDPVPDAPRYGSPSVAVTCTSGAGVTIAFHGLFGDAWLSCSLTARSGRVNGETGRDDALLDRAGRWCVTVAQAASA
jgi:hypothetical protein